eukprot:tig00020723_g13443.t1
MQVAAATALSLTGGGEWALPHERPIQLSEARRPSASHRAAVAAAPPFAQPAVQPSSWQANSAAMRVAWDPPTPVFHPAPRPAAVAAAASGSLASGTPARWDIDSLVAHRAKALQLATILARRDIEFRKQMQASLAEQEARASRTAERGAGAAQSGRVQASAKEASREAPQPGTWPDVRQPQPDSRWRTAYIAAPAPAGKRPFFAGGKFKQAPPRAAALPTGCATHRHDETCDACRVSQELDARSSVTALKRKIEHLSKELMAERSRTGPPQVQSTEKVRAMHRRNAERREAIEALVRASQEALGRAEASGAHVSPELAGMIRAAARKVAGNERLREAAAGRGKKPAWVDPNAGRWIVGGGAAGSERVGSRRQASSLGRGRPISAPSSYAPVGGGGATAAGGVRAQAAAEAAAAAAAAAATAVASASAPWAAGGEALLAKALEERLRPLLDGAQGRFERTVDRLASAFERVGQQHVQLLQREVSRAAWLESHPEALRAPPPREEPAPASARASLEGHPLRAALDRAAARSVSRISREGGPGEGPGAPLAGRLARASARGVVERMDELAEAVLDEALEDTARALARLEGERRVEAALERDWERVGGIRAALAALETEERALRARYGLAEPLPERAALDYGSTAPALEEAPPPARGPAARPRPAHRPLRDEPPAPPPERSPSPAPESPRPAPRAQRAPPILSADWIRAVEAGRAAFEEHLRRTDRALSGGTFDPTSIVESVADDILEELLEQNTAELSDILDAYVEGLFHAEMAADGGEEEGPAP